MVRLFDRFNCIYKDVSFEIIVGKDMDHLAIVVVNYRRKDGIREEFTTVMSKSTATKEFRHQDLDSHIVFWIHFGRIEEADISNCFSIVKRIDARGNRVIDFLTIWNDRAYLCSSIIIDPYPLMLDDDDNESLPLGAHMYDCTTSTCMAYREAIKTKQQGLMEFIHEIPLTAL